MRTVGRKPRAIMCDPRHTFLRSIALRRVLFGRGASAVNGQAVPASA
jgi:hypothetical protein